MCFVPGDTGLCSWHWSGSSVCPPTVSPPIYQLSMGPPWLLVLLDCKADGQPWQLPPNHAEVPPHCGSHVMAPLKRERVAGYIHYLLPFRSTLGLVQARAGGKCPYHDGRRHQTEVASLCLPGFISGRVELVLAGSGAGGICEEEP